MTSSNLDVYNSIFGSKIRLKILKILQNANAGHLGSSMSIVEMLIAMYSVADIERIREHSKIRDRIIVSKGHAAAATYATMSQFGLMDEDILNTYHLLDSKLQGHVSHKVQFVEHSTGALGHGLSVGVGHAIYLRNQNSNAKTMVLCGDGEIQEGSVWEALMLASTHNLNNLILLVDVNGISSITDTEKVIYTGELSERFKGFGLSVSCIDGHNVDGIIKELKGAEFRAKPTVLLCNTTKGKGVSFAENEAIWHYRTLNDDLYNAAVLEQK
jgi:transketolase